MIPRKLAAISLLLLTACNLTTTTPDMRGQIDATLTALAPTPFLPTTDPEPTVASTEDSAEPVSEFPLDVNPLTGLQVADISRLDRLPVAVKISNYPRSVRPQWGLSLADIVYEYYINNDLTRFYAIFYGQDASLAGPIRSGRIFDEYLTEMYKSVLVFASADARVLDRLYADLPNWQLIPLLDGPDCPPRPVCRYDPTSVNFLVTDTAAASDYASRGGDAETRPNLHGMTFDAHVPEGGEQVARIYNTYSYSAYSYWDYDPDSNRYYRYQDTQEAVGSRSEAYEPLVDRLTGEQVAADNVVILYIPHFHVAYTPPTDTEPFVEVVDMDFSGHALAYAFRDGRVYQLEWVREEGEVLYLIDANGEHFPLKPGTTWFQVHNDDSRLTIGEGSWHFEFIFRRPN
jgi:hypothetical protein